MKYRILALDVDGTLLDSTGRLRPTTADAVARADRAGVRPVLCTGRRYRRALPIAFKLGLEAPIVCNSGALVKNPFNHRTLWRADIDAPLVRMVVELCRRRDHSVISFTDIDPSRPDFLVSQYPTGREFFDEYVTLNRSHAAIEPRWVDHIEDVLDRARFHLCAVGSREEMWALQAELREELGDRIRVIVQRSPRYSGTMCEVIEGSASKWTAVLHLAEQWGVAPSEICAVGDDFNDLQMIKEAGLGVAMGHAPAEVRAVADFVTGDHNEDGVTQFVENVLLARGA